MPTLTVGSAIGRRGHHDATRLGDAVDHGLARMADSYCNGTRSFGRPMMALLSKQNLGPVRHALSQMVVAGTMTTSPPVQVRVYSPFPDAETAPLRPATRSQAADDAGDPFGTFEVPSIPEASADGATPEVLAAPETQKNKVFEMSLGDPEKTKVYEVEREVEKE